MRPRETSLLQPSLAFRMALNCPSRSAVKDVFPTAPSALPVGGCFIPASSKEELSVLMILYVIVLHFEMDLKHQEGICPLPSPILPRERDWK